MTPKRQIKKQHQKSQKSNIKLRIITLGGQEEVGRNMTLVEYGKNIIIIDMGLQFPEEDMPGIDYIIPNITYLKGKEQYIRGVIFSHGHLDHIGAAPLLLERLGNPVIIGRPLTLALVKNRQEDHEKGSANKTKTLTINNINDKFKLGVFNIGFFPVDHSIMDAVGIVIESPHGTIIHPGDWTYEQDPIDRQKLSYHHLSKLKKPTILMLESLGSTVTSEKKVPEKIMYNNLKNLIQNAPGRTIIATFSSQIERIKQIMEFAEKAGKKVALDGFSMKVNVETAKRFGYIKAKSKTFISIDQIKRYPDQKIIIICTGAQGEGRAVLSRIVSGNHRFVQIKKTDTIVFSSSVIPGNERSIQRLKDNLYRLSDNVVHGNMIDIHVSGHGTSEDMVTLLKQIRPTYFLPVYANHFFLKEAEKLAIRNGFLNNNIFILDNGSILEVQGGKANLLGKKVPSSYVMVDGLGVGDISNIVLRDRQVLSDEGMFVVIVTIEKKTGKLIGNPDIISRGFIYMKQNKKLLNQVREKVRKISQDRDPRTAADEAYIKSKIRDTIGQFLFTKTERRPMILPVVIEV